MPTPATQKPIRANIFLTLLFALLCFTFMEALAHVNYDLNNTVRSMSFDWNL